MRQDILGFAMENISDYEKSFKVNYSKVARRFNCYRRTVKAAFEKTLYIVFEAI